MTTNEKNEMLLKLYSLYNKSLYGEIQLEDTQKNITFNNDEEIKSRLMNLHDEGLIKFEYKPITGDHGQTIEIRIKGGIRFTEKGFDYLKELRKNKFVKFWELLYKFILPIGYLIDILWKGIAIFQKK
jgi:hypothetical protein